MDVELREPQDLQTAMYLARAFERRATATAPAPPPRGARPPQRPGLSVPPCAPATAPAPARAPVQPVPANAAPPARPFRCLSPAEQLKRRCQVLCYNCNEPYVCGHVCPRLFYLESADYIDDEVVATKDADAVVPPEAPVVQEQAAAANALVVSLHAPAGIRMENTMLLPVTVKGECLLTLLNTGSTHNFL